MYIFDTKYTNTFSIGDHQESESITARQILAECPQVKKKLWGGQFWTDGYFVGTVGKNQNETVIQEYVKNQGNKEDKVVKYKQLYLDI